MKTKVLLPLSMAALVSAAQLSAAPQIASGAYAGLAAGVSVLGGKNQFTSSNDTVTLGNQAIQDQGNFSLSKSSPSVALFGGYGLKFSGFWTAVEAFYQFDNLKDKQTPTLGGNLAASLKSSTTGGYGAAVHLGFVPAENCVTYVILGAEARKFKVAFSGPAALTTATIKKNYTSFAFAPGVGVRFALTKDISIRTEYKYAMSRSKTLTASAADSNVAGATDIVTIKHQPKVQTFNVGVIYNF